MCRVGYPPAYPARSALNHATDQIMACVKSNISVFLFPIPLCIPLPFDCAVNRSLLFIVTYFYSTSEEAAPHNGGSTEDQ